MYWRWELQEVLLVIQKKREVSLLKKLQTGCTYNFRFAEEVPSQLNQVEVWDVYYRCNFRL